MAIKPQAENAVNYSKELIDYGKPPDGCGPYAADQGRRLFLQPVPLGQANRRQRQDEERHQPKIYERAAKHVNDPFLPLPAEKRQPRKQARHKRGGHHDQRRPEAKRKSEDHYQYTDQL
jgi:hypothetical protein